ncbi:hypothetical protein H5410_061342 [Solanum commersonii]|uniref:Uncharacterized protein n=1 Tax=Solanum commersonii TaxID=4109 RepID=A0A9J5W8V5_SOLCO|nr:hypothetical protein H5410_061342 [Solanum commersonii]
MQSGSASMTNIAEQVKSGRFIQVPKVVSLDTQGNSKEFPNLVGKNSRIEGVFNGIHTWCMAAVALTRFNPKSGQTFSYGVNLTVLFVGENVSPHCAALHLGPEVRGPLLPSQRPFRWSCSLALNMTVSDHLGLSLRVIF